MKTINQPVIFVFQRFMWIITGISLLFLAGVFPVQAHSITEMPDGSGYQWKPVYRGLVHPVDFAALPGESGIAAVVEQGGFIRLIGNGMAGSEVFLDIRDRVGSAASEQGLLGLAFHPKYAENRYFFVNYTNRNGDTVIARFTAAADGKSADAATETQLLQVDQPYENHNGGGLAFGPDGYLYIALGDGGSAGDPQNNAQNLDSLLGKLLRVDVNAPAGYVIPPDNPFINGGGRPEIWAYGLRNPWKFSFDSATGDLWIADVGQRLWEEIDFLPAGSRGGTNFGWNIREGSHPYNTGQSDPGNLVDPVYEYDHQTGCSITGGMVYRGMKMPEWQGVYFFGDYCKGTTFGLARSGTGLAVKQLERIKGTISAFGVDDAGELYALEYAGGIIYRLEPR